MNGLAVMVTAWRRPYYLEPVLESWLRAMVRLDAPPLYRFVIALGQTDRYEQQLALIEELRPSFPVELEIAHQSHAAIAAEGPHQAIGEAGDYIFSDESVQFLVFGEEDVIVSDDALRYMAWASEEYEHTPQVLLVCAHNRGGMAWDFQQLAADQDADQQAVQLLPYFNPWVWGTWRDRWVNTVQPGWGWSAPDYATGYDWSIMKTIMLGRYLCVVPDAARSQNIGEHEGLYATPETWSFSHSQSFRAHREPAHFAPISRT